MTKKLASSEKHADDAGDQGVAEDTPAVSDRNGRCGHARSSSLALRAVALVAQRQPALIVQRRVALERRDDCGEIGRG